MNLPEFTIDDIRTWRPCYNPARYLPEGWRGNALDILAVEACSRKDRLWVVLRTECIPKDTLRLFARKCALSVAHLWDMPEVVRLYLETGDETLRDAALDAALDAAWDAALDAARAAAWDAARDVAWYATRATAWDTTLDAALDAAWYAAWDAALDAARAAAWDTTRDKQVAMLRELLS